jgi:ribosomal protein S18 acetylase RimI-like enzyme
MMTIRRFVEGVDEADWLRVQNEAYKQFEDFRPDTVEDMELSKKTPNFSSSGMFIAEQDGIPVGVVNAFVDRFREEKIGSLRVLGVVPEFRRRGIGRRLLETGIESLRKRGMEVVQGWTRECGAACKSLLEGTGFALTRTFCSMRADLKAIPCNIGEHEDLRMRKIAMNRDDIELVRWLHNETFKDHFNFRPRTSEEYQFWLTHKPWGCDTVGVFIAYLDGKPVGFVEAGVDTRSNEQEGAKRGWILSTGVLKQNRNKGIGTAMVRHAMEFLKSQGMIDVELGVDAANPTNAIELYEKMGFKIVRRNMAYTKKILTAKT